MWYFNFEATQDVLRKNHRLFAAWSEKHRTSFTNSLKIYHRNTMASMPGEIVLSHNILSVLSQYLLCVLILEWVPLMTMYGHWVVHWQRSESFLNFVIELLAFSVDQTRFDFYCHERNRVSWHTVDHPAEKFQLTVFSACVSSFFHVCNREF